MSDADKLLKLAGHVRGIVEVGEKIMSDGKINVVDLVHLKDLASHAYGLALVAKNYQELLEEGKDLDAAEAVAIVQALFKK